MYLNNKKLIATSCILTLLVSNAMIFTSGQSVYAAEMKKVVQTKSQPSGYERKYVTTAISNVSKKSIEITMIYPTAGFKGYKLGEEAKATFKVNNNTENDISATLIMALYDKSNKFINFKSVPEIIKKNDCIDLTGSFKVLPNGYKVKCFVWDSLENMNPLTKSIQIPVIDDNINDEVINFPDINLEKVIRDMINKPFGNILKSDVDNITNLLAIDKNISNISGIENFKNLTKIYLSKNQISNIDALNRMTNLTHLLLDNNKIRNIDGLKRLTNLTTLYLKNNQITDYSPTSSYYKNLIDKDFTLTNLTNLIDAIKAATKQLTEAKVGSYEQADIETYKAAISETQRVADKADVTQAEVNAAIDTLAKAKVAFESAIKVDKELVSNNKQEFYDILKNALENCETTVKIKVLNYNNSDYKLDVINRIVIEHPEVDYGKATSQARILDYGGTERFFEITLNYKKDTTIIKQEKEAAQRKVQEILSTVIKTEMTDFEKELALHDYIVKTADYDVANYTAGTTTLEDHTAYGVLVDKRGVCESYAKAMYELLNGAGIECKYVTGFGNGAGHAWNIVKLEDQWYNLDTTWDDPVSDINTNANKNDMLPVIHKYFNVPDAIFNQNHKRGEFEEKNYPSCTATKYSYENMDIEEYTADGILIEKVTSKEELDAKILAALQNKKTVLYIRLKGLNMNIQQLIDEVNKVRTDNNLNIGGRWGISMPDTTHAEYTFEYQ